LSGALGTPEAGVNQQVRSGCAPFPKEPEKTLRTVDPIDDHQCLSS
jgi:hypothetical protein